MSNKLRLVLTIGCFIASGALFVEAFILKREMDDMTKYELKMKHDKEANEEMEKELEAELKKVQERFEKLGLFTQSKDEAKA